MKDVLKRIRPASPQARRKARGCQNDNRRFNRAATGKAQVRAVLLGLLHSSGYGNLMKIAANFMTRDPYVMGERVSPPLMRLAGWITFALMSAATAGTMVT